MHSWDKEGAFRVLLHKIATKATPERLAKAADFALENDEAAVKYVSGIIMKDMKQLKPIYKLRVFYAFSSIARASVAKYGSRSKYAARWGVKLETISALLTEIPPNDKIQVGRVLQLWWRDGIFPPSALTKLQSQFPASPAPTTTSKTSSQKSRRSEIKKSHLAGSASTEKTHRYWDPDLGTEVVITKHVRHDAPASPDVRDVENPAQEPSPADDSPLPCSSRQVGAAYDENADEINEDDLMPRAPRRRMFTLESNRRMGTY